MMQDHSSLLFFLLFFFIFSFPFLLLSSLLCCCCLFMVYTLCLYVVSKTENKFKPLNDAIDCTDCKPMRLHSVSSNHIFAFVVVVVCDWLDGLMGRLIDQSISKLKSPSSLKHFLTQTVFHFGFSQLHGLFVEANLHETIQVVEHQPIPSQKQTAPLRAQANTKVMMINWIIN